MTEPTDDEIAWLAIEEGIKVRTGAGVVKLARAVLAKWGQPAQAAEPVAWLYTTPMPDGSTFVGASSERLQIGIGVTPGTIEQPLYLTPQPVAREPLTSEQLGQDPIFRAGVRFAEQYHGIKGGQHVE